MTKALYEPDGNGNIRVTHRGLVGIFGSDGRWISGELRQCDPHMCGWVAGPQLPSQRVATDPV
ncbi:MAG: hypothetical protein ABI862_20050 [Ilumatobacteraceae bacterium]